MQIRRARLEDRESIRQILLSTERFRDEEIGWAMELVDDAISRTPSGGYDVHVLETAADADPLGYVCFGPVPMTEGVFDLYWIAVNANRQGEGLGRRLLEFAEEEVVQRGGRMLLIETRSRATWTPTHRFYERNGYQEISRIKDFYRIEDDKVVYAKRLTQP